MLNTREGGCIISGACSNVKGEHDEYMEKCEGRKSGSSAKPPLGGRKTMRTESQNANYLVDGPPLMWTIECSAETGGVAFPNLSWISAGVAESQECGSRRGGNASSRRAKPARIAP